MIRALLKYAWVINIDATLYFHSLALHIEQLWVWVLISSHNQNKVDGWILATTPLFSLQLLSRKGVKKDH